MTSVPIDALLVANVLTGCGLTPARGARPHWLFAVSDAGTQHGVVTWRGEWLTLSAGATGSQHARNPWALLRANATLPGTVRYASTWAGRRRTSLCIDIWLGSEDLPFAVDQALRCLRQALQGERPGDDAVDRLPSTFSVLPAAFADLPWPHRALGDGRLRIDLESRGLRFAAFASEQDGVIRIQVELATQSFPPIVRRALGAALLVAAHQQRLVRASVSDCASDERLVFEVATDLAHVAAAITVLHAACETFGPEARALQDPALAAHYLDTLATLPRPASGVFPARRDAIPAPAPSLQGDSHVVHRIA